MAALYEIVPFLRVRRAVFTIPNNQVGHFRPSFLPSHLSLRYHAKCMPPFTFKTWPVI